MRPLLSAFRGVAARTTEQVKTPVPYVSRYATSGYGGMLAPSGDEAQLHAVAENGTLFGVVESYTTAMAGIDWNLYRSLPPGAAEGTERPLVTSHAALDLWNKPNPFYSQPLFVKTVTQHLELLGTGFAVVVKIAGLPIELWPVRPDRMEPVKDPRKFIAGWIYHGPDGEMVPLTNDVVIRMVLNPCPWDPYRGMGAVQAVMTALSGAAAAEEWHRQFFKNSARPDGVVQVPNHLSDTEFDEFNERWMESHQGVLNAHRVAILEYGATWEPTGYSPHDMMFVDLQKADGEKVREAHRASDTLLGKGQALNRATAEAQMFQFSATQVVPRLDAVWKKEFLNGRLLPMYGRLGQGLEFDFVDPTPEDKEAKDRNILAQSTAYKNYVEAGVEPTDEAMLRHLGLPEMKVAPKPEPPPALPPPALAPARPAEDEPDVPEEDVAARWRPPAWAAAVRDETDSDHLDLSGVLTDLERELARLEDDYVAVRYDQIDSLVTQVEAAVEADDLDALAAIALPASLHGSGAVERALLALATTASERATDEVAADVALDPDEVADEVDSMSELPAVASAVAATVAADLALSAAREALRLYSPGVTGSGVASQVRKFLDTLKGVERVAAFGAALHRATNVGRGATFTVALREKPGGKAVAFEMNDLRTCQPCSSINGHVFASVEEALATYGAGGYPYCLGGRRCRGTWYPTWS